MKFGVKDFQTFGPKAVAGIGKLPDTVADRSLPIVLQRRKRTEPVERWREREGRRLGTSISKAFDAWASTAMPALQDARPDIPLVLGDRAADVLEPLLAIADMAGADWPQRARQAAVTLMGEVDDDAVAIQLLADLKDIFGTREAMATGEILHQLAERDDRPWATWSKGQRMTGHALARLLKPFGVVPSGPVRFGDKVERAYRRSAFVDVWDRYLSGGNDDGVSEEDEGAERF